MENKNGNSCLGSPIAIIAVFLLVVGGIASVVRSRRPGVTPPSPQATTVALPDGTQTAAQVGAFAQTAELPTSDKATSLVLILDTSGSMDETVQGGGSKLQYAKQVLTEDFLPVLSDDLYVALYRFEGVELNDYESKKESCVVVLSPLRKNGSTDAPRWTHREALMEQVDQTRASGGTPIVHSMRRARGALAKLPGRKILVLVTDGEESYEGKDGVLGALKDNTAAGIETYVVGFNLGDQGAYLKEKLGLGKGYFDANGGRDALLAAMQSILSAIEK